MQTALISIHDVMPATLDHVQRLITLLRANHLAPVTLLVVPGVPWSAAEVDRLRRWRDDGCHLAGHGWQHRCELIRGWRHRLHSWVISRDVAEHLAATPEGSCDIIHRCAAWFLEQGLTIPSLYVPPAWTLGSLPAGELGQVPFPLVETQFGVLTTRTGAHCLLPLVGFEADTAWRARGLRGLNALNRFLAVRLARPLRIALHPHDLELRMHTDVLRTIRLPLQRISYAQLLTAPTAAALARPVDHPPPPQPARCPTSQETAP